MSIEIIKLNGVAILTPRYHLVCAGAVFEQPTIASTFKHLGKISNRNVQLDFRILDLEMRSYRRNQAGMELACCDAYLLEDLESLIERDDLLLSRLPAI